MQKFRTRTMTCQIISCKIQKKQYTELKIQSQSLVILYHKTKDTYKEYVVGITTRAR